ncbi:tetratricopeptide repeat protein [bacterium]|nr:tetratricopeptide repeat protein [bacterium]
MNTNYIEQKINIKDLTSDSPYNPYLIGNNEKQIEQICDFLQNDKKLLLLNGFAGSGKGEILNYTASHLNENVVLIKYMCLETTILDDMLLSFFESFRNYAIKGTITLPKGKVDNFTQKINSYFNAVTNPVVVVLHSFQAILKENKKEILNFIEHLEKFENIKIILSSRTFDYNEFGNVDYDRVSILAFSKEWFEKYLRDNDIKNIGPLSNELYKQTRGYYTYVNLSVRIMKLRQYSLVKFLEVFSKSGMGFSEFVRKEALMLIDPVSLHLFRLLALMRIPLHVNLIKSLHLFNQERIYFFVQNYLLSVDGESLYLKDFFREIIEQQIQQSVMLKLHKACVDLYETQLPLKPLERDLRLSRQTMRNEIDYHSLFIPKKPQMQNFAPNLAQFVQPLTPKESEPEQIISVPAKEETKEEKIEKINFIFDDESILDNIASSINNFIQETVSNKEIALNGSKMTLTDILNSAKQEEAKYNYKHAVLLYQNALNKTDDDNFDTFLPTIYQKLVDAYKHLSDWHNALEYLTKLQDYYFNISENEKAWEVQLEMANIYFTTYKQDNAKYILHELDKKENLPNDLRIKVYLSLAKISGNLNEEFSYYQKSVKLITAETDKSVLAQLFYRIAGIFDEKDDIQKASFYYKKCIEIKKDNHYLSRAMANLAELYDEAGNTDFAVKYYEKSIEIDKEAKNYNGLYSSTRHLSEIFAPKDSAKSLEYLKQAYNYAKELNEPFYIADVSSEIGNFYLLRKDFENAYKYFIQAKNTAKTSMTKDNAQKFDSKIEYLKKFIPQEEFDKLEEKYGK